MAEQWFWCWVGGCLGFTSSAAFPPSLLCTPWARPRPLSLKQWGRPHPWVLAVAGLTWRFVRRATWLSLDPPVGSSSCGGFWQGWVFGYFV